MRKHRLGPILFPFIALAFWSGPAAAATTHTWIASASGNASANGNWSPLGPINAGDSVIFNSGGTGGCTWDINVQIATFSILPGYTGDGTLTGIVGMQSPGSQDISGAFTIGGGSIEWRDSFGPFVLDSSITINGGRFHIGQTTLTAFNGTGQVSVKSGGMLEMHDLALFKSTSVYVAPGGALHLFDNSGGLTGAPTLTSTGAAGAFLDIKVDGQVDVSSGIFGALTASGFKIGSSAALINFSSVTFSGPLQPGTTAINFYNGGTFVSTMTSVRFVNTAMGVNVNAAGVSGALTMRYNPTNGFTAGPRAGSNWADDPSSVVSWPDLGACGSLSAVAPSGAVDSFTISGGVAQAPPLLAKGNHCVAVNSGTYGEQVTVANIVPNSFNIVISSKAGSTVVVNPPAFSTAGFVLANTSVVLAGMTVRPTSSISYGILASSANATISSSSVDSGGNITTAGIAFSSQSVVSNSSVTVQFALGLLTSGSNSLVAFSTAVSQGGDPNGGTLYLNGASSNTITQSYFAGFIGRAAVINSNGAGNLISQSTFTSLPGNSDALLLFSGANNNFVTQSVFLAGGSSGRAVDVINASSNTVSQSSMTSASTVATLNAGGTLNTFAQDFIFNSNPNALASAYMVGSSDTVTQSTITSVSQIASLRFYWSTNTVSQSYISNAVSTAVFFEPTATYNTLGQSVVSNNSAGSPALLMLGSSNTIVQTSLSNASGPAGALSGAGNIVSQSSFTGNSSLFTLQLSQASSTTINGSVIQGLGGLTVSGSTTTAVNSSLLLASGGDGLDLVGASQGLSVATATINGGMFADAVRLGPGNSGTVFFDSVTVSGSRRGLDISAQAAGATLSISSMIFSGLPSGTTAIFFQGGTFVSTFTNVNFADPNIDVNINASALNPPSQIYFVNAIGPKAGPSFQAPDAGFVTWITNQTLGSQTFSGNFAAGGSKISGTGIFAFNAGSPVAIDNVTAGGPFYNIIDFSSNTLRGVLSSPTNESLVRYDANGNLAGTVALSNDGTNSLAIDSSGNIYLFDGTVNGSFSTFTLKKFSPSLALSASFLLSGDFGGDAALASDGTFLYAAIKGSGSAPPAKIVKFNSNLVPIATATYQIGGFQTNPLSIDAAPSGDILVTFSTNGVGGSSGGIKHLAQYSNTLAGSSVAVDISFLTGSAAAVIEQASDVYVAGATQNNPQNGVVTKFLAGSLANTGINFTLSNATGSVLGFPTIQRSPDGDIILAGPLLNGTRESYGAIKFDLSLNVLSSATFNGPGGGLDNPGGLAVVDANTVVLTGTSQNALGSFDAITTKLSLLGPTLNFTGTFAGASGAVVSNSAGNSPGEIMGKIVVDKTTAGGPFTYGILNDSLLPFQQSFALVKYDASGVKLASAPIPGYINPEPIAVDNGGDVYIGWRDLGTSRVFLNKFSPALNLLAAIEVSSSNVGTPERMGTFGTSLFVQYPPGANTPSPLIVRYDFNLNALSTATTPAGFSAAGADIDDAGNIYLAAQSGGTSILEKFDPTLTVLLSSANVTSLLPSGGSPVITAAGPVAFLGSLAGSSITISRLRSNDFTYTGVTSTITPFVGSLRLKATSDGNLFASALYDPSNSLRLFSLGLRTAAAAASPPDPNSWPSFQQPRSSGLRAAGVSFPNSTASYMALKYDWTLSAPVTTAFKASGEGGAVSDYGLAVLNPFAVLMSGAVNNAPSGATKTDAATALLPLGNVVPPNATCAPVATPLSVSALRFSLPTAFSNYPMSYNIYAAGLSAPVASVSSGTFDYTGLSTNTAYSISFAGVNTAGQGSRSISVKAYTMAAPPTGSSAAGIFTTSATVAWQIDGNPLGTTAWVDRSTDSAFNVLTTTLTASTSYTDSGLLACTTYYLRVRNLNGDKYPTAYDSTVSFATQGSTPSAPGNLLASSLPGNRVGLVWDPSGPEGITAYKLYFDGGTGVVPSTGTAPFAVLPPSATSFISGVLVSSASYSFHLTAVNRCGVEEALGAYAAAAATLKPAAVRAAVANPAGRGGIIDGASNALTLSAAVTSGASKVLFQYKSAGGWTDIGWAFAAPFTVSWDVTGLAPGAYQVRAVAFDAAGKPDGAPSAVTITIAPPGTPGAAGETSVGGVVTKTILVDNTVSNTIVTGAGGRLTTLVLPPGAVSAPNPTVSVISNPSPGQVPAAPGFDVSAGVVTQIVLGPGQSLLPGATASFTVSYPDPGNTGFIQGTKFRADTVRLISNSGLPGASWNQDIATSVDLVNHTLTGITRHFSFFAAAGAVQSTLDLVRVYPNPFKPNGTDPNEGRPYTGAAATGLFFDNLPAVVTIKIYTISGTLVAQMGSGSTGGALVWDARTDAGRDAASGAYFAIISSPVSKPVVKRFAIVR